MLYRSVPVQVPSYSDFVMCNCETASRTLFSFKRVLHIEKSYAISSSQALSCIYCLGLTDFENIVKKHLYLKSEVLACTRVTPAVAVIQDILRM